jgi:hypothetical protein
VISSFGDVRLGEKAIFISEGRKVNSETKSLSVWKVCHQSFAGISAKCESVRLATQSDLRLWDPGSVRSIAVRRTVQWAGMTWRRFGGKTDSRDFDLAGIGSFAVSRPRGICLCPAETDKSLSGDNDRCFLPSSWRDDFRRKPFSALLFSFLPRESSINADSKWLVDVGAVLIRLTTFDRRRLDASRHRRCDGRDRP